MPLTPFYSVAITTLGWFCLDSICHRTVSPFIVCETPPRNQVGLIASPVLACVLDCACRDKPSWRGHSCDMGDNQRSSGVVIAGFCSFRALDHQRRVLHQSSLPYLSEDRDSTSYQHACTDFGG
jgi:hypothetical protein